MAVSVSIGQAACNALAKFLRTVLTPDCTVYDRWPEPGVDLFAPLQPDGPNQRLALTVHRFGRRTALDVVMPPDDGTATQISDTQVTLDWQTVSFIQPIRLVGWANTDDDRDDLVNQLDTALSLGTNFSIPGSAPDNPVRDGVQCAFDPADGYQGYIDYYLDEVSIDDDPASVQRAEMQLTYWGEARGGFARVSVPQPNLTAAKLKIKPSPFSPAPASQLYDAYTIVPGGKITHDQEP